MTVKHAINVAYVIIISAVFFFATYHLEARIAWNGFTPVHYVSLKLSPENFVNNFPSGVEQYDKSLFMQIYVVAKKVANIDPNVTMRFFILAEIIGLVLMAQFISSAIISSKHNALYAFALSALLIASAARNIAISNFGTASFIGQFYNVVDVFRIVAILMFFQRKYTLTCVFFFFAICTHIVQAILALAFCLGGLILCNLYLLRFKKLLRNLSNNTSSLRNYSLVIGLIGLMLVGVYLSLFQNSSLSYGAINLQEWLELTKLGNYHWYPYANGWLTLNSSVYLGVFFSFIVLLIHYLPQHLSKLDLYVIFGMVTSVLLSIVGVIISIAYPEPWLVKIALFRSLDLIAIFGLVYIVKGLIDDAITNISMVDRFLALTILLALFTTYYNPFSILLVVLISRKTLFNAFDHKTITIRSFLLMVCLLGSLYCFITDVNCLLRNLRFVPVTALSVILIIIYQVKSLKKYFLISLIATLTIGGSAYHYRLMQDSKSLQLANDFLDVQIWARNNTKPEEVFFVDPTIYYGWRDFSERSSFGSIREWLHVSWLYDSNSKVFNEGLRRFQIFDINYSNYLHYPIAVQGFDKLNIDARDKLYSMSTSWFQSISQKYNLQYIVLQKKYQLNQLQLIIHYENEHFIVYKV
jgi:hypothetical protein